MSPDDIVRAYQAQMAALLQEGPAWAGFREADGNGARLLEAKADMFAAVHRRLDQLLAELLPWQAAETLTARETEAGLPDTCTRGRATTVPERHMALADKWAGAGAGHRVEDFEAIAARLGYAATVTASRPARCGPARCGDRLNPPAAAFHLRVTVHGPRRVRARCGTARCGDPLLKIQRAEDLECRLRKKLHSHADMTFIYEEA
ncbi:MAG: DUF2313 domain-containing protein [Alphaproteobacteria bacterium]|nr:DUF2313 domain-containing protein [Alphaproteobacteria bacterium]